MGRNKVVDAIPKRCSPYRCYIVLRFALLINGSSPIRRNFLALPDEPIFDKKFESAAIAWARYFRKTQRLGGECLIVYFIELSRNTLDPLIALCRIQSLRFASLKQVEKLASIF